MVYLIILSILINFSYYFIKNTKALHMLQQNWYNEDNRYVKWILISWKKVFFDFDFFFVFFGLFFLVNRNLASVLFILFYILCIYNFLQKKKKDQVKKPLSLTKRVKRLILTLTILYLLSALILLIWLKVDIAWYYLILGLITYFNYFIVLLAVIINIPIEKMVHYYFYHKAYKKISNMPNLKVIGITGSYGKTSSKNILNDILSVKYNTCPTPKNYNTTNGLMLTINNYLDKLTDVLIAEMGAFKKGEIKELCKLVRPKYAILTRIGQAHLDTFGSIENIRQGKFELVESLPEDGVAILNRDDELQVSYPLKNTCKVIWIGIDNDCDIKASNIRISNLGMKFDCTFKGDKKKYAFETKLLGKSNIYNILAAIALGDYFGIPRDQLIFGVKKVKPVEHRLEIKKYGDITLIDDAYNSNPTGSKMALEVLDLMPGKKIIVTPGMIELGTMEDKLNYQFGKYISEVCDEVILVGEAKTKPIYDGLIKNGYNKEKIHVINDVKMAFPLMQSLKEKDTYVLLENDLPDIFNEK